MNKMPYRAISFIAAITLAFGTYFGAKAAGPSMPAAITGGTLVWADEFNGSTLSSAWSKCHWWSKLYCTSQPNNELQLYAPGNVSVSNGQLNLKADKQSPLINYCDRDCRNYSYTSGMVQSGGNEYGAPIGFAFTYGYIETRMKVPAGKGMFPAFWLWPADRQDPPEIDIMEMLGDQPGILYMTYKPGSGNESQGVWTGVDYSQDYHTFGLDWQPNVLIWYVDGVERYRWTGTTPNEPMYPIFNLAIGGSWAGTPDANTKFPSTLLVDYVRVYSSTTASSTATVTKTLVPTATSTATSTATPLPSFTPTQAVTSTPVSTATLPPSTPTSTSIPASPTFTSPSQTPTSLSTVVVSGSSEKTFDDKDGNFIYSPGWKNVKSKAAYNGSYKSTTVNGSYVVFPFRGQSFSILYTSGRAFRKMQVYVDDILVGTINESSSTSGSQVRWEYPGQLALGDHVLKLVFETDKRSATGSVDAVIVR